jgi:hypothetical protein
MIMRIVEITALRACTVTTRKRAMERVIDTVGLPFPVQRSYENTHGIHLLEGQQVTLELEESQLEHLQQHIDAGDITVAPGN